MPIESKAQQRFMYAHQNDPGPTGAAAREFIAATPKSAYKKLPARVGKRAKPSKSFGRLAPMDHNGETWGD